MSTYAQYCPKVWKLDSATGWKVFPDEPDVIKIYDNIHVYWCMASNHNWNRQIQLSMSIDGGQTWKTSDGWYGLYNIVFGQSRAWERKYWPKDIGPILKDKANYLRERANAKAKAARDEFKKLDPKVQEAVLKEREERKICRTTRIQNRKNKEVSTTMAQMIELGPALLRLREGADEAIRLMSTTEIRKDFPYFLRTLRDIKQVNNLLNDRILNHIKRCQKKSKGK